MMSSTPLGNKQARNKARRLALVLLAVGAAVLGGCAGFTTLGSEVSSFGEWPAGRKPGTYAFERLPSQEARGESQKVLEEAAKPALAAAGFVPAAEAAKADVLVQVAARASRAELSPWADPLWWRGAHRPGVYGPWMGPRWNGLWYDDLNRIDREAALLIRDRATGKPLYEARAQGGGSLSPTPGVLRAMYAAALKDFPAVGLNPRTVNVPLVD
jgi:Domain of unknown function (DUF4136)